MKRCLPGFMSMIVFCFLVTCVLPAHAANRYVNGGGCGGIPAPCYTSVSSAVAASSGGDVIYIYPGTYTNDPADLNTMLSEGDISLITVDGDGDPSPGTATLSITDGSSSPLRCNGFSGNITINGLILRFTDATPVDQTESGLYLLNVTGNITLTDVDAASSSWDAMAIYGCTGNVTITRCAAHNSHDDGFSISGGTIGNLTIRDSVAEDNVDDGFSIYEANIDNFTATDCAAESNGDNGFNVEECLVEVTMTRCTARNNLGDGFDLEMEGNAFLTDCVSENNDDPQDPDNDEDGFDISAEGNITMDGCAARNNGQEGIDIEYCSGAAVITGSTAQGNGGEGIDTDILGESLLIERCRSLSNAGEGIEIAGIQAPASDPTISCCDIVGNYEGLHLYDSATVQAVNNWWGSVSGPDASDNPGGTGDSIVIEEAGTVNYNPWLSTVFSESSTCSVQSIPTMNTWGMLILAAVLSLAVFKSIPGRREA